MFFLGYASNIFRKSTRNLTKDWTSGALFSAAQCWSSLPAFLSLFQTLHIQHLCLLSRLPSALSDSLALVCTKVPDDTAVVLWGPHLALSPLYSEWGLACLHLATSLVDQKCLEMNSPFHPRAFIQWIRWCSSCRITEVYISWALRRTELQLPVVGGGMLSHPWRSASPFLSYFLPQSPR